MSRYSNHIHRSCAYVSDLHGARQRYNSLTEAIRQRTPDVLFIGGDLLHPVQSALGGNGHEADLTEIEQVVGYFMKLQSDMKSQYPRVFLILGNDDTKTPEAAVREAESRGLWTYAHNRKSEFRGYTVYGYSYINPSPYLWKDWEKYDVSRFVDPGCVSPEEGYRSADIAADEIRYSTISEDLEKLAGEDDLAYSVLLFHAPPYQTNLDRASLDGKTIDHVPLDVNVGSIAVQRFIESRQPLLTLHGHVHESARLTGSWRDRIGRTHMFSAAHDGSELAIVWFNLTDLENATRELI
jgi:Icc-related predicted phosphoesterase